MFLWALARKVGQRDVGQVFNRGVGTVSERFTHMLHCMNTFSDAVIRPRTVDLHAVHAAPHRYTPYFDGAIGAIDGCHIEVSVDKPLRDSYLNRHGRPSQNVLAVCDFDMRLTFLGVGMAGAVHDMAVLRTAWKQRRFPHPPPGTMHMSILYLRRGVSCCLLIWLVICYMQGGSISWTLHMRGKLVTWAPTNITGTTLQSLRTGRLRESSRFSISTMLACVMLWKGLSG